MTNRFQSGLAAIAAMLLVFLVGAPALAQSEFKTPTAGQTAIGTIGMCLNASGQAVPIYSAAGAWQCATGSATPVSQGTSPWTTQTAGHTHTNIATSTNTVIKATPGVFVGLSVNTGGTLSTATVYDAATCTGTKIATFATTSIVSVVLNATATTGICVTTADTGGVANVTVLWR